ncbi:protein kinase/lanthionine synthetase C family protein [Amycolatopsis sp. K13G38]|uniref:non-specific serine/threonine protein kinase n=1 Tax=Amycolatopsis acididurans TaxID=2724524 RepID=A0ABX1J6M3_9PSEU|nr:class III lanthionine synthetase LanKC [Amycolatopsis acididurans]NKQ55408.1 protein kinase/lanthionine synthetase C family protein [Amycolatopsis acididurans]
MDLEYEAYCFADPLFFDEQRGASHAEDDFAAVLAPLAHDWVTSESGVWRHLCPVWHELPDQGWKIHVSGTPSNVDRVLAVVHRHCLARDIAFKHLRTRAMVLAHNSKYAPREGSGKLATIYPKDEKELESTLLALDAELSGEPGPYILSDLRYGAGPLYVRYGGFAERWVEAGGRRVLAVRKPDGMLVPDERRPVFHLPDWVELPECLAPHLAARRSGDPRQFPYRVTSSLHFSNGGGVYLAEHKETGREVVLKEARPHAGLDRDHRDAVARLHREHEILERLEGIPGIPAAYERFVVWEHHFLAMRRVRGRPLGSWLARNYPLTRRDADERDLPAYADRALALLARLEGLLDAVHERGIVYGDLHPMNVLVDDDDQVSLVDFELAFEADGPGRPTLGAPGFKAPADRCGFAIDEYALAALKLWIFLPLNAMLEFAPGKLPGFADFARRRFGLPPAYVTAALDTLAPREGRADTELDKADPDWSLVRRSIAAGILASATPQRTDRLFPGDIEQFRVGGACFAVGAAGILHALHIGGGGRHPEYERWLIESVRREPPTRPGFHDGAHGIAYVLENFGHHGEADELLKASAGLVAQTDDHGLYSGLSGIALNLLHFAETREDKGFLAQAVRIAARIAGLPAEPVGKFAEAGLTNGWSGPALLFVRLYEHTGDQAWLDLADRALCRDLEECVTGDDGSLQVRDGQTRTLPYLGVGSAGIAVVAGLLAAHRPDAESAAKLPGLRESCRGEFVIQPGLLHGRAGLTPALGRDEAEAQLARLAWHAVPYGGGIAFPGNRLLRLSMDVATGGAGVLLALAALDGAPALPFLGGPRTPAVSGRGR